MVSKVTVEKEEGGICGAISPGKFCSLVKREEISNMNTNGLPYAMLLINRSVMSSSLTPVF